MLDRVSSPMLLNIEEVQFRYGGLVALDSVSFSLKKGHGISLVGPNGSGKSTLIDVISGFLTAHQGGCTLGEISLHGHSPSKIAELGLCRTFQYPRNSGGLSCFENVLAASLSADSMQWYQAFRPRTIRQAKERAQKWLDTVGLSDMSDELAATLSFGQSKLLNLACVLVREPKIVLLDEPVAGVAKQYRHKLISILEQLKAQDVQILIVEHDLDFVRSISDSVIVLDQGKILAQGATKETLALPKVLKAYVG